MLDLQPQHLRIVISVLDKFLPDGIQALIFGSRIKGTARKYSDVDICLKCGRNIPPEVISNLEEAFSLSDLPFGVDVVIYRNCTDSFQQTIDESSVKIYPV